MLGLTVGVWARRLRTVSAAIAVALGAASAAMAETLVAGPDGVPASLTDALARAADGDTIELLSGAYRGAWLLENRRLTLVGMEGKPALLDGESKIGSAKALLTVRGGEVTLKNIEFRGARSAEGNGAGVRFEGGRLVVDHCTFFDNEHGLLATNAPEAELRIESSVFGMAPHVVGGLYHLLNVGRIGKLSVTGTRFQQGFEGHLIKSRARESVIRYNFIHDGQRGGASYQVEFAAGGLATLIGNVIAQGADGQNPVLVAYATEGGDWPRNQLLMAHNTFINYSWMPAWFVRVRSERLTSRPQVVAINNLMVGPGLFWPGLSAHTAGNRYAWRRMLTDTDTYAFELPPDSVWRRSGVDPRNVDGVDLSPKAEFQWPVGTRAIGTDRTQWTPGAYQR